MKTAIKRLFLALACPMFLTAVSVSAHEHHAPHRGTLVVLGEEFAHVELTLDPVQGVLTGYVLDGEAENPIRIVQDGIRVDGVVGGMKFTVKLEAVANPLSGEKKWDTSEFQGRSKALVGVTKFEGTLLFIRAKGTNFRKVWFLYPEGNEGVKKPEPIGKTHVDPKQK